MAAASGEARPTPGATRRFAGRARRGLRHLTTPRAKAPAVAPADGLVEVFEQSRVAGWVATVDGAPVRVGLFADELEVAAAWATDEVPGRPGAVGFQFRLRDLWRFVGSRDLLTVRVAGAPVPVAGHGTGLRPKGRAARPLKQLEQRLAAGHVFGQGGRLQLSKRHDHEWQAMVMGLYQRVRDLLAERFGYDVFLVYGTLLGAVREGGVIGHDVDFDCAFVSRHRTGPEAAADLRDIAFYLIDEGFDVECRRTALHLHDSVDPSVRIDLFHLYFDERDELAAPFGVAGTTVITRQQWTGMKEIRFCDAPALVPVIDEAFAEHLYGATWRLPKPGFDWHRDRTTSARAGILPISMVTPVLWENTYAHRNELAGPSSLCRALLQRDDLPRTVIDVGCGDGRDTHAFAARGRRAVGLDRSPRALELARGRGGDAEYVPGDVAAAGFAERLGELVAGTDGPVLFYLRFLVHAIEAAGERALLAALGRAARPGDLLAAEFRTPDDESLPKANGKHFRRFVDGPGFDERLAAAGFECVDVDEGTGLSAVPGEDPVLHRVVARYA